MSISPIAHVKSLAVFCSVSSSRALCRIFLLPFFLTDELAAKGRPWQKNTLITLLNRLVNKGFLKAKKIGRRNEYTPLVSEAEYQTAQTKHFLEKLYEGSASGLVATLISGDLLTDDEYDELRQMLERE